MHSGWECLPTVAGEVAGEQPGEGKGNSWMPGSVPKLAQYSLLDLAANSDA